MDTSDRTYALYFFILGLLWGLEQTGATPIREGKNLMHVSVCLRLLILLN